MGACNCRGGPNCCMRQSWIPMPGPMEPYIVRPNPFSGIEQFEIDELKSRIEELERLLKKKRKA